LRNYKKTSIPLSILSSSRLTISLFILQSHATEFRHPRFWRRRRWSRASLAARLAERAGKRRRLAERRWQHNGAGATQRCSGAGLQERAALAVAVDSFFEAKWVNDTTIWELNFIWIWFFLFCTAWRSGLDLMVFLQNLIVRVKSQTWTAFPSFYFIFNTFNIAEQG
jgi:hypothetical protein